MYAQPRRYPIIKSLGIPRLAALALSASLIALLVAIPAGSAAAAPTTPSVTSIPIEEVLSKLPVSNLGTTTDVSKEVAEILHGLPSLDVLELGKLEQSLTALLKGLPAGATLSELVKPNSGLKSTLETTLNGLLGGLGGLLGGNPAATVLGGLGSLTPTQLVDQLLKVDPSQLPGEIAAGLNPASIPVALQTLLGGLLGTTMTGAFGPKTVEETAKTLGTSVETLTKALEPITGSLDSTTKVLTAPLENGKLLGLLDGVGGLSLNILGSTESKETGKEGSKETGKETGKEGSKETNNKESTKESATPGSGSQGSGGASVVVNNPLTEISPVPQPTPGKITAVGKIKILSHRVKGKIATLVVQAPAAGVATLKGSHVSEVSHQADKSERVTLKVTLSRAVAASLHKHHKRLKVALEASFKPVSGSSSAATVTVTFA